MLPADEAHHVLLRFFQKHQIADLDRLQRLLKTRSRMTVFRRLSSLGYLSSCSHSGRYYTLKSVPAFDADGLWRHQGVCFSRDGTLMTTVPRLVESAEAGQLHRELQEHLQMRVHNTLAELVAAHRIGRETFGGEHLYVSAIEARAAEQLAHRRSLSPAGVSPGIAKGPFEPALVIAVLSEVIHATSPEIDEGAVARRLSARGLTVTAEQVAEIVHQCGVEKKTARSRSRRSPH